MILELHGVMPTDAGLDLAAAFLTQTKLGGTKLRKDGFGARGSVIEGSNEGMLGTEDLIPPVNISKMCTIE